MDGSDGRHLTLHLFSVLLKKALDVWILKEDLLSGSNCIPFFNESNKSLIVLGCRISITRPLLLLLLVTTSHCLT